MRIIQRMRAIGDVNVCKVCSLGFAPINCDECWGRALTMYNCPHCNVITHFKGRAGDGFCRRCNKSHPSIHALKTNVFVRRHHHIGDE
jgi:hypothetical protein